MLIIFYVNIFQTNIFNIFKITAGYIKRNKDCLMKTNASNTIKKKTKLNDCFYNSCSKNHKFLRFSCYLHLFNGRNKMNHSKYIRVYMFL